MNSVLVLLLLGAYLSTPAVAVASWYGEEFHGGEARNGETFDMLSYTFAANELFGKAFPDGQSYLICTPDPVLAYWPHLGGYFKLDTEPRCITARWTDTGTLDGYSQVDLSKAAFEALFEKSGVGLGRVLVYSMKGGVRWPMEKDAPNLQ